MTDNNTNTNTNGTTIEFEEIMVDKNYLIVFRDFLKTTFSSENLSFWVEAELFKTCPEKKLAETAQQIYDKYFKQDSNFCVNLDDRKTLEALTTQLKKPHTAMFANAQNRIWGLLKLDSYPRFRLSELYNNLCENSTPKPSKEKKEELKRSKTIGNIDIFIKRIKDQKKKTGIGFQPPKELVTQSPTLDAEESESENLYDQPEVEEILDDEELLLAFREFLYTTYANENLAFWIETEIFRHISDHDEMVKRCSEIFEKFCKPDSPQAINLDWNTQILVKEAVKTPASLTFRRAQLEIWKVLKNEWFPEFCVSQVYKDLENEEVTFKLSDPTRKRGNTLYYYDELQELRKRLQEEEENKRQNEKKNKKKKDESDGNHSDSDGPKGKGKKKKGKKKKNKV